MSARVDFVVIAREYRGRQWLQVAGPFTHEVLAVNALAQEMFVNHAWSRGRVVERKGTREWDVFEFRRLLPPCRDGVR